MEIEDEIKEQISSIHQSFESEHLDRMLNTSWKMPREFAREFQEDLYQERVEQRGGEYIEYLAICCW